MSTRKQLYYLTEDALWRLVGQGTHTGAANALDRVRDIKAAGGCPQCFYSDFNSFIVVDENNPKEVQRSMSMLDQAKPYPI